MVKNYHYQERNNLQTLHYRKIKILCGGHPKISNIDTIFQVWTFPPVLILAFLEIISDHWTYGTRYGMVWSACWTVVAALNVNSQSFCELFHHWLWWDLHSINLKEISQKDAYYWFVLLKECAVFKFQMIISFIIYTALFIF